MSARRSRRSRPRLGAHYWSLFTGDVLSNIGSQATQTAITLQIFKMTGHSISYMGLATLSHIGCGLVASPLGGVLADRINRRTLLLACDLVRLLLVLALPWTERVGVLLGIAGAVSAATAMFSPARQALIADLVPTQKLDLANSLISGSQSAIFLAGPLAGASLYVTGGMRAVVLADAASYAVSFMVLCSLGRSTSLQSPGRAELRRFRHDLIEGVAQVVRRPDLAALLALSIAAGLAAGVAIPLLRPLVGDSLSGGDATYALILAGFGFGGLLGPGLAMAGMRWLGLGRALMSGFLIESILMLIWSQTTVPALNGAVFGLWGACVFALIPCEHTYLHARTPPAVMARTFALMDQTMYASQIIGALVVIMIGDRVRPATLIAAAAALYLVVVAISWPSRGARLLRSVRRLDAPVTDPLHGSLPSA